MPLPVITPLPPVVRGLPKIGSGVPLLWDPTAYFTRARARHGDTFVTDAFGYRLLCLFSPEGVQSLYSLEEKQASFGLATYTLIKFKMPEELLFGRRVTPHGPSQRRFNATPCSEAARFSDASASAVARCITP